MSSPFASPFASRSGCPMCGIVAYASTSGSILSTNVSDARPLFKPGSGSKAKAKAKDARPEILYRDDDFTVYEEKDYAVSSLGHLVICFNLHVPSIYTLSSSDVPLLIKLQEVATRLLSYFTTSPNVSPAASPALTPQNTLASSSSTQLQAAFPPVSPISPTTPIATAATTQYIATPSYLTGHPVHIGFISPPFKDPKIPVGDHLHAHAYIGELDRVKWYDVVRKTVWNMGWWDVADLIAEIREQTSNNRVKSGGEYAAPRIVNPNASSSSSRVQPPRQSQRPIDQVANAGARGGLPNGIETTIPSLGVRDLEAGDEDEMRPSLDDREALAREWEDVTTPTASGSGSTYPAATRSRPANLALQHEGITSTERMLRSPAPLLGAVDGQPPSPMEQDLTERPMSALSL